MNKQEIMDYVVAKLRENVGVAGLDRTGENDESPCIVCISEPYLDLKLPPTTDKSVCCYFSVLNVCYPTSPSTNLYAILFNVMESDISIELLHFDVGFTARNGHCNVPYLQSKYIGMIDFLETPEETWECVRQILTNGWSVGNDGSRGNRNNKVYPSTIRFSKCWTNADRNNA